MKEAKDLSSSYIANCVLNAFLSYTAIMLNSITIHAIRKTSSLPKPLKTLLLSLAVSDVGVGLIVQPLYIACLVMELQQNNENNQSFNATSIAYRITGFIFTFATFFGVVSLSADRFLAIHLHLRYQELVTHKRVVGVIISTWVLSAILSSMFDYWNLGDILKVILGIVSTACIITITFFNFKIYVAVRRHAHQIQALQLQQAAQNGEMANVGRLKKSAVTTVYVYLVFLVCYLPQICRGIAAERLGIRHAKYRCWTLLFDTGVSQFISQPFDLLLENERHSTQYHKHNPKCIFKLQLKIALVIYLRCSEVWNVPANNRFFSERQI